jgi:hypothetical protein
MRVNLILLMRVYILKKNKIDLLLLMRVRCICIYMDMHIYTHIYRILDRVFFTLTHGKKHCKNYNNINLHLYIRVYLCYYHNIL